MTSYNKDRYPSVGKLRRSSPGDSHAHGAFFQTGQGGRTILPPLADSFPTSQPTGLFLSSHKDDQRTQTDILVPANYNSTPYNQPRSTPKLDYNLNPPIYGYQQPTGACKLTSILLVIILNLISFIPVSSPAISADIL